jgi:vacuolar-type H+-ATPase subunit E/Vma4
VALADILQRIEEDSLTEAAAILREAEQAAAEVRAEAQDRAKAHIEHVLERTRAEAEAAARTRLATVRLAARDNMLGAKRHMVERVLADIVEHIETLPADQYADFLARQIKTEGLALHDAFLSIGHDDHVRLVSRLEPALAAADVKLRVGGTTGAIDRGVLIEGDRVRVEVSARALVASRRDRLVQFVSERLFANGSGTDTDAGAEGAPEAGDEST